MSRYDDEDGTGWREPDSSGDLGRQHGGRARRRSTGLVISGWVSIVVVAALVVGSLGAYVKYRSVWDSINRIAVTDLGKRPPKYTNAMNILLLGSDNRAGANGALGGHLGCNCSDTIMLVHISPGRRQVTALSIPRDTMVPYYSCASGPGLPGQPANPAVDERINQTLETGGPVCVWKTVEQQTGIRIDHFIQLDFTGFVNVVNDIGGVNVCLPFAVDNAITAQGGSGLKLSAGKHHINGKLALEFWRTREAIGYGSDLQRIQRDQYLMAQVVRGVLSSGMLSSPTKLLSVVKDAASAMTTDSGLTQSDLLQIASSMKALSAKSVQFVEVRTIPWPANPNVEVEFEQPDAGALFSAIAHDTKLPKPAKKKGKGGGTPVLDARPSQVKVTVLNGSGVSGLAGRTAANLTSLGFDVVGLPGDAASSYTNSVIEYASATDLPAVNTLKKQLSSVTTQQDASMTPGTIDLILGSSFSALVPPSSSTPAASKQRVSQLAQNYGGITASAACRSDTSAFAGPLSPTG